MNKELKETLMMVAAVLLFVPTMLVYIKLIILLYTALGL